MSKTSKPSKVNRVARETAAHLRDLVAAFCRARDGVEVEPRRTVKEFGTVGATWRVPTQYGAWLVHEPSDPCTGLVSINTRFEAADLTNIRAAVGDRHLNFYSGKWNHNVEVYADNTPESVARAFILAFDVRSRPLFSPRASALDMRADGLSLRDFENMPGIPLDEIDHDRLVFRRVEGGDGPLFGVGLRDGAGGGVGQTPRLAMQFFAARLRRLANAIDEVTK